MNTPPPYAPPNFNAPNSPPQNKPMTGPMGSPYPSGPMMNQAPGPIGPMMNQPPQMMQQPQMPPMQMNLPPQMGTPQYNGFSPQIYPYGMDHATVDVTQCKEATIARCPTCHFVGMTRVEKKFSTCQLVVGIIFILTVTLAIPGILILVLASDYEHFCTRCNNSIGRKKTCSC